MVKKSRRQHLSQEELAALVEPALCVATIANLEPGRTRPHGHPLEALSTALQLDADQRAKLTAAWRALGAEAVDGQVEPSPSAAAGSVSAAVHLPASCERSSERLRRRRLPCIARGHHRTEPDRGAIAQALGLPNAGGNRRNTLRDFLHDKHLLLVLDNFEHLLPAAPLVPQLLAEAAGLNVLVTSREALHVSGEHSLDTPPLRHSSRTALPPLEQLTQYEAVRPSVSVVAGVMVAPIFVARNDTSQEVSVASGVAVVGNASETPATPDPRAFLAVPRTGPPGAFEARVPPGQTREITDTAQLPFDPSSAVQLRAGASLGVLATNALFSQRAISVQFEIPLQMTAATSADELKLELNADSQQWCVRATDSRGARPTGTWRTALPDRSRRSYRQWAPSLSECVDTVSRAHFGCRHVSAGCTVKPRVSRGRAPTELVGTVLRVPRHIPLNRSEVEVVDTVARA